jgi:hypothetical protein
MFFMATGKAASELVVAKAIDAGSRIALKNPLTGILKIMQTGTKTATTKKNKAIYRVARR